MASLWTNTVSQPLFKTLKGDLRTDVLIIGGGITGLLCAHKLKEAGVKCVVAEADEICRGVTANTTAKLTSQHGLIYSKLLKTYGAEKAKQYLLANEAALGEYRRLCASIDCDYLEQDSYVYSLQDRSILEAELAALEAIGFSAQFSQELPLPFPTVGAVKFPNQAQFHPLKFLNAIASGLNIYENTRVRELVGCVAVTENGRITADKIIVATHFPFLNKHGMYFLKLYQDRSYVLELKNAPTMGGMYVDESGKGLSFRNHGDVLLLGGGSHRTGKQGGGYRAVEAAAQRYYPQAHIRNQWATQDCMSLDSIPYIGRYSSRTQDLYVATGFNKWGMTSAMVSATILSHMITGKESPYAPVFSPSRSMLHPQLGVNALESACNLLTPTAPRCPHLGCALKWNPQEHSWDCPCHGSRFDKDGHLLDNPATGGLEE